MIQDYLNLHDGKLFYTVSGNGDPILFIHGNFNDNQIWNEQIDFFSQKFKTIRYDLRGYGLSSKPGSAFSNVDDLKTLVDYLKLQNIVLVGSSMGGGVALDFTLAYPHLVETLVVVSPTVSGIP